MKFSRCHKCDLLCTDLNVGVKLNEAVWPGGSVDLVPVLTVKLPGQILQEAVGRLLAELPLCECEEAGLLLNDVTAEEKNQPIFIMKNNFKLTGIGNFLSRENRSWDCSHSGF